MTEFQPSKAQLAWTIGTRITGGLVDGHGHHLDEAISQAGFTPEITDDLYQILFKYIGQELPENYTQTPLATLIGSIAAHDQGSGAQVGGKLDEFLNADELSRLNGYTQQILDVAFSLTSSTT